MASLTISGIGVCDGTNAPKPLAKRGAPASASPSNCFRPSDSTMRPELSDCSAPSDSSKVDKDDDARTGFPLAPSSSLVDALAAARSDLRTTSGSPANILSIFSGVAMSLNGEAVALLGGVASCSVHWAGQPSLVALLHVGRGKDGSGSPPVTLPVWF